MGLDTSAFTHQCHVVACVNHLQVNMDTHRQNSQGSPSGSLMDTEGERNIFPVTHVMFASLALARPSLCGVLQVRKAESSPDCWRLGWVWY